MTIHTGHPFADPTPDPVRRLRARIGGAVTLWTAGDATSRAGLTLTSVMIANGEPARFLGLVDPDSDLADEIDRTERVSVALLSWHHRDLADAFAGVAPAPGGMFTMGAFADTAHGPRLADATSWAAGPVEATTEVGWSRLVVVRIEDVHVGDDDQPLLHRRGRYATLGSGE